MKRLNRCITAIAPLTAVLFAAAPAQAEDTRLVERRFDPGRIVKVEGRANIQATIQFDNDELIENIAIGDSAAWQVTPNKRANLLFVKPLQARAATNLTVVTSNRTYYFDLVASPQAKPLYALKFTYPDDPKNQPLASPAQSASATELAAASDPYAVHDPARLNHRWDMEGDKTIFPSQIYDDGDAVFLTWPKGEPVPAILVRNAEGVEGPVNYTVRENTIVVDNVPERFFLRSGQNNAILTNRQPETAERRMGQPLARAQETR